MCTDCMRRYLDLTFRRQKSAFFLEASLEASVLRLRRCSGAVPHGAWPHSRQGMVFNARVIVVFRPRYHSRWLRKNCSRALQSGARPASPSHMQGLAHGIARSEQWSITQLPRFTQAASSCSCGSGNYLIHTFRCFAPGACRSTHLIFADSCNRCYAQPNRADSCTGLLLWLPKLIQFLHECARSSCMKPCESALSSCTDLHVEAAECACEHERGHTESGARAESSETTAPDKS